MENMMTFKFGKRAIILLLLFALGCANTELVTQDPLPSQTSMPERIQATVTPKVITMPENVFTRPLDGMQMIHIPGGEFQMGSNETQIEDAISLCNQHYSTCNRWYYEREGPQHPVSLDDYWIDQLEVSNDQYRLCVDDGICSAPSTCESGEPTFVDSEKSAHPVVCVNWEEAQTYCQWIGGRLPTEAEWEYAFRGSAGSTYPWGNEFEGSRLNYCDMNCSQPHADDGFDDGYPLTAPVGSYPSGASWSGTLNMSGNVSEWVADWFEEYEPKPVSNPLGPNTGFEKTLKGCSWSFNPSYCRGAARHSVSPDISFDLLGFRCAMSNKKETQVGESDLPVNGLVMPRGQPSALDGTISSDEWKEALVKTFADGSEIFLMRDEEFLYVGIRASETGTIAGNVFIHHGDEISILHSSAALGTAVYQRGEAGWKQIRDFTWRCRNTGNSASAQTERTEFLQDEGWLATNGLMGTPNELEYKIKIPDQGFRVAAVYIKSTPPYEKIPWPTNLNDDCVKPTPNGLPKTFYFLPEKWIQLISSS